MRIVDTLDMMINHVISDDFGLDELGWDECLRMRSCSVGKGIQSAQEMSMGCQGNMLWTRHNQASKTFGVFWSYKTSWCMFHISWPYTQWSSYRISKYSKRLFNISPPSTYHLASLKWAPEPNIGTAFLPRNGLQMSVLESKISSCVGWSKPFHVLAPSSPLQIPGSDVYDIYIYACKYKYNEIICIRLHIFTNTYTCR